MTRFLIRRLILTLITIIGATAAVFGLSRAAGDPILLYAKPGGYGFTPEQEAALRKKIGIDKPLVIQYTIWLGDALTGDLGKTILDEKPVSRVITQKVGATVQLSIVAWLLATLVGVPLGVLSAVKRGSIIDYIARGFALFGQAIPPFWLGIVLILIASVQLSWFPVGTRGDGSWDLKYMVLPAITLAWGAMAGYVRLTRTAMLEVLDTEYVKLARAKGVSNSLIIWKHAFRNALIQPLTASTLILAGFLTGSIVVESIFAWPGMGLMAIKAVNDNDFPVLQGVVLMFTVLYTSLIFLTDIAYAIIDPRIRFE
jgi:peptide/nickel transport system permease protein